MAERGARDFADKCVVVTGASGGIGRALARRFARDGARVALLDVAADAACDLADELSVSGAEALPLACDVTSELECAAALRATTERFGGIDVLVANAGITHLSAFRDTEISVIRRVMEVNFFGAVNCTKAALASLVERRGQIVVISSFAGLAPLATRAGYAASKHALNGFFGSLRAELSPSGVGVTLVCPTFVDTAIGAHALGGDGGPPRMPRTSYGTAVSPEALADEIHAAALARRRLLVPFRQAKLAHLVARLLPAVYERSMAHRILPTGTPRTGG